MRVIKAHRCRVLLVMLLLGFAALTVHASMHAQQDQQGCELCGGHFNPTHAVAPSMPTPFLRLSIALTPSFPPQIQHSETFSFYRQRAPPVPS